MTLAPGSLRFLALLCYLIPTKECDVVAIRFLARANGMLYAAYSEYGQYKTISLPTDEALLEIFIKRLRQSLRVTDYEYDDSSLTEYALTQSRKRLHRVLSKLLFSCEVCGDPVKRHYTDEKGITHSYCKSCYVENVLGGALDVHELKFHDGYNVGNDAVLRSDLSYHGWGVLEDYN